MELVLYKRTETYGRRTGLTLVVKTIAEEGPFKLRPEERVQVSSGNADIHRKRSERIQHRERNMLEGSEVEESKEQEKTMIANALLAKNKDRNGEGKRAIKFCV